MDVDAVSSATKSKPKAGNLVGGSYHVNSDGSDISGVIFPVKIKKGTDLSKFTQVTDEDSFSITVTLRGTPVTTTYTGKDALFERPDYAYYVLNEIPSYYKEVSVDADGNLSFGEAQGTADNADGVSATLSTSSQYGDYQLGFTNMPDISSRKVLGIVLHTTEGEDFGLRHLENIWQRTQLAWSVGFTDQSHGSPLSSEHYKDMMGKHLSGATYYTSEGILEVPFTESVYVPVKLAAALTVENAATNAGAEGITVSGVEFPPDFDLEYQVKNSLGEAVAVQYDKETGKLTWEGNLTAGSYTLTVTDKSGKYAPVSGTFTLETESVPATFTETENGWKITKAEDASDSEFLAYLAAISQVKVGETEYAASGRGAVKIIDATTGEIDFTVKSNDQSIFTIGEQYTLEVTATGYKNNLIGTVTATEKKTQADALEGEATVETTGVNFVSGSYQAKVSVTVDADGKIVSVKDNGTEPGTNNQTYWDNAQGMFVKLVGKTADEIDSVDKVSMATVSSNAIKKAVKNALSKNDDTDEYQYLLMNIPYADFYAAEIENNNVDVDAVSSATLNKTRTGGLVGGSYHVNSNGFDISGVIYPVRIKKGTDLSKFKQITDSDSVTIKVTNRGVETETPYVGKDALFESEDYSYYLLSEEPEYYKELTIDGDTLTFGEAQTDLSEEATVSASLQTESNYGDYQLSFEGLSEIISDDDQVYGVVLHTKEDVDYGLRHLENIWLRTNLAWSTGFVTTTHGNTLAPEHYKSMMGKTITGLTYFTNNGIADITLDKALYVPYKFTHENFGVTAASASAGTTTITGLDSLPEGFDATYTFTDPSGKNTEAFTVDDNAETITWNGSLAAGTYTLTVTDESETYADLTTTFVLSTAEIPVQATANSEGVWSLTAAEEATEDQVASYLASITSVSVSGTAYSASGRGAVQIIDPNTGRIKTETKSGETAIFTKGYTYELVVTATGYDNALTFTMVAGEAPKPEGVEVEGSAAVDVYGYQAKVKVTYDAESGEIKVVEDNGTEPGDTTSKNCWTKAWNRLASLFVGKTKDTVDTVDVDIVSGATYSARALKKAVKNAIASGEEKTTIAAPTLYLDTAYNTYSVVDKNSYVRVRMAQNDDQATKITYTTNGDDPTADDTIFGTTTRNITVKNDGTGKVVVKAAAFDDDGNRSDITEFTCVFTEGSADPILDKGATGYYEGKSDDITATILIKKPSSGNAYIQNITLNDAAEEEAADFIEELKTRIYVAQSADVELIEDADEELQNQILNAVAAAIKKAVSAEPVVTVTPSKYMYSTYYGKYNFDEPPVIELSSPKENVAIYYAMGNMSSVPAAGDDWKLYTDPFKVEFTNTNGGTLYVHVGVSEDGGASWLKTKTIRITYDKEMPENAAVINGENYNSLEKALKNVQSGDTIILNADAAITSDTEMPDVDFEITSAEGEQYSVSGTVELNGDLTVSNLTWKGGIYANGHNFTAGENMGTVGASYYKVYAGSQTGEVTGDSNISVSSGQFWIYGSGYEKTTMTGDVSIHVGGSAKVRLVGVGSKATLNGNVEITVDGTDGAGAPYLYSFVGKEKTATANGNLTLKLIGDLEYYNYSASTFKAVEDGSETNTWGTLDITETTMDEEILAKFKWFETVETGEEDQLTDNVEVIDDITTSDDTTAKTEDTTITDEIVNEDETEADQKSDETTEDTSKDETSEDSKNESSDDQKIENTENTDGDVSEDEKTEAADSDNSEDEKTDDADGDKSEDEKIDDADTDTSKDEKIDDADADKSEDEKTEDGAGDVSKDEKTEETNGDVSENEKTEGGASNDENTEETGGDVSNVQTSEESGSDNLEEKTSEEQ